MGKKLFAIFTGFIFCIKIFAAQTAINAKVSLSGDIPEKAVRIIDVVISSNGSSKVGGFVKCSSEKPDIMAVDKSDQIILGTSKCAAEVVLSIESTSNFIILMTLAPMGSVFGNDVVINSFKSDYFNEYQKIQTMVKLSLEKGISPLINPQLSSEIRKVSHSLNIKLAREKK